jgi:hypothetical protein
MKLKVAFFITVILMFFVPLLCISDTKNDIVINGFATTKNSVVSSSRKYDLNIIEEKVNGVRYNRFIITKHTNKKINSKLVFKSKDSFRVRDITYFTWGKNDSVWVYSGDVGTFFWKHIGNKWNKFAYADNKSMPVPDLLKKVKPNYYTDTIK